MRLRMNGFVQRFLKGLAEIFDSLNIEREFPFSNPTIAIVSALILTTVAAFSYDFRLSVSILILSFMLITFTRSPIISFAKIMLFVFLWTTFVSIPTLFITHGETLVHFSLNSFKLQISFEGLYTMITFIARVVSAAAIFTSLTLLIGWRKIIRGLEGLRVPKEITLLLNLSIIHMPFLLREASKMLSAREARIVKNAGLKDSWLMLATVVGDLFIRSYERALGLERAIRARSLVSTEIVRKRQMAAVKVNDLLLLSLSILFLISNVLGML